MRSTSVILKPRAYKLWPFSSIMEQGYGVVASDIFVQYRLPGFSEEDLEVHSYIIQFRGARMTWQQELYRCRNGDLLARAEVNGAFTDTAGHPSRIPSHMRDLLSALLLPDAAKTLARRR